MLWQVMNRLFGWDYVWVALNTDQLVRRVAWTESGPIVRIFRHHTVILRPGWKVAPSASNFLYWRPLTPGIMKWEVEQAKHAQPPPPRAMKPTVVAIDGELVTGPDQ